MLVRKKVPADYLQGRGIRDAVTSMVDATEFSPSQRRTGNKKMLVGGRGCAWRTEAVFFLKEEIFVVVLEKPCAESHMNGGPEELINFIELREQLGGTLTTEQWMRSRSIKQRSGLG